VDLIATLYAGSKPERSSSSPDPFTSKSPKAKIRLNSPKPKALPLKVLSHFLCPDFRHLLTTSTDLNDLEWHTVTSDELVQRLSTSLTSGLSADQIKRRLQQYGRNAPSPPKSNLAMQIFGYFFKGFGGILLVAAILVFIAWRPLGDPNPALANLVSPTRTTRSCRYRSRIY
jgi:magnesium-transporting ATPase (P-type)